MLPDLRVRVPCSLSNPSPAPSYCLRGPQPLVYVLGWGGGEEARNSSLRAEGTSRSGLAGRAEGRGEEEERGQWAEILRLKLIWTERIPLNQA